MEGEVDENGNDIWFVHFYAGTRDIAGLASTKKPFSQERPELGPLTVEPYGHDPSEVPFPSPHEHYLWIDGKCVRKTQDEIDRIEAPKWRRRRRHDYPTMDEQLDMLYHDLKSGNLENGSWVSAIDSVKAKYPKV